MMQKYRSFVREQKVVRTLYLILLIVVSLAFLLFLLSKLLGERQHKIDLSFYLTMISFLLLAALGVGVLVYLNRRIRKFKRLCADEAFPVVLLAENGLLQEIPLSKKQTVLIAFQFRTADDALKFLKKRRAAQQKIAAPKIVTAPIPGDAQIAFRRSKAPVTVYSRPLQMFPQRTNFCPRFILLPRRKIFPSSNTRQLSYKRRSPRRFCLRTHHPTATEIDSWRNKMGKNKPIHRQRS